MGLASKAQAKPTQMPVPLHWFRLRFLEL